MTPADAARILAVAAAFDRRTVGELDAHAWADALHDLNPTDCLEAARAHYRHTTDWLMPAHIRTYVENVRRARIRSVPTHELDPDDADPNDLPAYLAARRRRIQAIADGAPIPPRPQLPRRDVTGKIQGTLAKMPQVR
jgi:hypothetical protein